MPDSISTTLAPLLAAAAKTLGREVLPGAKEAWARPQSPDSYAILVAGRGAALYYGALPPLPPEDVGDKKKDPITKAIFLDPAMPVARWIAARRARELGQSGQMDFARAAVLKPSSLLFAADAAASWLADGDADAACAAWAEVDRRSPADPRFAVARGRAAVRAGRYQEALSVLDGLGDRLQDDREVVELRVEIADATGPGLGYDELLGRWQRAAVDDPEPVRRRLALRVQGHAYRDALEFTEELAIRGEKVEATRVAMALAVGLAEWELAAREADSLGLPDVASDLRVRAAIEADPHAVPDELLTDKEPEARVVEGGALLGNNRPAGALAAADQALAARPWYPEALALRSEALRKLGRFVEAEEATRRLRHSDPAWGQDRAWGNDPLVHEGPSLIPEGAPGDPAQSSSSSNSASGGGGMGPPASEESTLGAGTVVAGGPGAPAGGSSGPNTAPGNTKEGAQSQPASP